MKDKDGKDGKDRVRKDKKDKDKVDIISSGTRMPSTNSLLPGDTIAQKKADSYAEILGDAGSKSESSYDSTGLTGSQEELGLSGTAGMNVNTGPFGHKGMSDISDSFSNAGANDQGNK